MRQVEGHYTNEVPLLKMLSLPNIQLSSAGRST